MHTYKLKIISPCVGEKNNLLCLQTLYLTFDIRFRENYNYVKCRSSFYTVLNILQESTLSVIYDECLK